MPNKQSGVNNQFLYRAINLAAAAVASETCHTRQKCVFYLMVHLKDFEPPSKMDLLNEIGIPPQMLGLPSKDRVWPSYTSAREYFWRESLPRLVSLIDKMEGENA